MLKSGVSTSLRCLFSGNRVGECYGKFSHHEQANVFRCRAKVSLGWLLSLKSLVLIVFC